MGSKYPLISKKTMATWNDSDYITPIIRRSLMRGGLPAEMKRGRGGRSKQLTSCSAGRRGQASQHDLDEIKILAPSGAVTLRAKGSELNASFSHPPQEGSVLLANDSTTVAQVPLPSAGTVAIGVDLMRCPDLVPALAVGLRAPFHHLFLARRNFLRAQSSRRLKIISQSMFTEVSSDESKKIHILGFN